MSQLSKTIETKAKVVVTEGVRYAKLLLSGDPDLKLMFSSRVGNYFPVVLTVHKRSIRNHCPEEIVGLVEECMSIVTREGNFLGRIIWVPAKLMDVWTEMMVHHFHTEAC